MLEHRAASGPQATSAESLFRQGLDCRTAQRHGEAMDRFRQALLLNPSHRETLLAMAALLGDLGRWQDAVRVYERAHHCFPDDGRISELLDLARIGRGRASFVNPGPTVRVDRDRLRRRGTIIGFLAFGVVVYTYITVGLLTHFTVGLAAAGVAAALLSSAGTLLFPHRRANALRAILRGMLYGLGATALVALGSIVIALVIAARDTGPAAEPPSSPAVDQQTIPL